MESRIDPVNLEIIAVGPLYRELDFRGLGGYLKKPVFSKHAPLFHRLCC